MCHRLRWRSDINRGDEALYLSAAVIIILVLTNSLFGQEEFSIHKAKVVSQSPFNDVEEVEFSISKQEAIQDDKDLIEFSVHNARPLSKPDVGDSGNTKPDCSENRQANRVLVFVDLHKKQIQKQMQICERGKPCRLEMQLVEETNLPSQNLMKELGKLDKNWKVEDNVCGHFKIVDVSDVRNSDMCRELNVKSTDVPMLIKESNSDRRKKASGMSAKNLMEWWNQQYMEPSAENSIPTQKITTTYQQQHHEGHNCPKCGRLQYDIHNNKGPVSYSHIHKCGYCGTSWYHADKGHIIQKPVMVSPSTLTTPRASKAVQTSSNSRKVALRYTPGGDLEAYALQVAHNSARAPPTKRPASGKNGKKTKDEKRWISDEKKRIRREVNAKVWERAKVYGFDPFTIISIILTIIRVLSFIFDAYGLD